MRELRQLHPKQLRRLIRKGQWDKPTAGLAMGYAQANVVILPEKYAFDFLLFCQRNPKPCPLLEVLERGKYRTEFLSSDADIRTDVPRYTVYRKGRPVATTKEIKGLWQPDFVTFLLGCSFSFEEALLRHNIPIRHIEEGRNVPMYKTNIPCIRAGIFQGPMTVSMRPIAPGRIAEAVQTTARFTSVHGAPIHIGAPEEIGIRNLRKPDFGDPVTFKAGEIPVFWACGVTPQTVVMETKPDLCITHTGGHMFITDILNEALAMP